MRTSLSSTNPMIGLLSVGTCTALAALAVPHEFRPAGALFVPALVLVIGLLVAPIEATLRSLSAAFRVEHLLMAGLCYWILLDLLQGVYGLDEVGRPAVASALAAIGVFACGVWLAGFQRPWPVPAPLQRACRAELSSQYCFLIIVACAAICLFRFAWPCRFDVVLMVKCLGGTRFDAPWVRGGLGGWDAFIDHLPYFGYLLPTLTVLLANKRRSWTDITVVISIVLTIIVMAFLAHSGSRRIIGVMIGSALICWVSLPNRMQRPTTFILGTVGAVALLLVMQVMLEYRMVGYSKILTNEKTHREFNHLHVDDNFLRLAQIIEIIPEQHNFTREQTILWVLVRPVPRVLWPSKPTGPGFNLPDVVGIKNTSLSSSVLGELYMSWGWIAIALGGWVYGRLAGVVNQFLTTGTSPVRFLMFAAGAMALFAGVRSLLDLVLMSYMLLAWYGLVVLFNLPIAQTQSTIAAPARGNVSSRSSDAAAAGSAV